MKEEEESFMTQDKFQAGKSKVSGGIFVGDSRMLRPVNRMKGSDVNIGYLYKQEHFNNVHLFYKR